MITGILLCIGALAFLFWGVAHTERSAQKMIEKQNLRSLHRLS